MISEEARPDAASPDRQRHTVEYASAPKAISDNAHFDELLIAPYMLQLKGNSAPPAE